MIFSEGTNPATTSPPELWYQQSNIFGPYLRTKLLRHSSNTPQTDWIDAAAQMVLFSLIQESKAEYIFMEYQTKSFTSEDIARYTSTESTNRLPSWITESHFNPATSTRPRIKFVRITRGFGIFKFLDDNFTDMKHVSLTLQQSKNHCIRIYQQDNNLYIITTKHYWEVVYKVIALIPKFFPNLNVDPKLTEMLMYFATKHDTEWLQTYTTWFQTKSFAADQFTKDLAQLFEYNVTNQIHTWENSLRDTNRRIQEYNDSLSRLYRQLQDTQKNIQCYGLRPPPDPTELTNYVLKHPYITHYRVNLPFMYLTFVTPLQYYDVDALKAYYKNDKSFITRNPFIARLFQDIFIKQRFIMSCASVLLFNFRDINVVCGDTSHLTSNELFPHPHLMFYRCLGSNAPYINKAFAERDYVRAIEQAVAATHNINFLDITVLKRFITEIQEDQYSRVPCFEYQGNKLTLQKIKDLYAKEDENETN